jgi:hypothetical protein
MRRPGAPSSSLIDFLQARAQRRSAARRGVISIAVIEQKMTCNSIVREPAMHKLSITVVWLVMLVRLRGNTWAWLDVQFPTRCCLNLR